MRHGGQAALPSDAHFLNEGSFSAYFGVSNALVLMRYVFCLLNRRLSPRKTCTRRHRRHRDHLRWQVAAPVLTSLYAYPAVGLRVAQVIFDIGIKLTRLWRRGFIAAARPDALALLPMIIAVPVSRQVGRMPLAATQVSQELQCHIFVVFAGFGVMENGGDLLLVFRTNIKTHHGGLLKASNVNACGSTLRIDSVEFAALT